MITVQESITWRCLSLVSGFSDKYCSLTDSVESSFSRKGVPVAITLKFNNSMTRSYSNRCCYIFRFEGFAIVLVFFVGLGVRNSCIETLAERIELADFNF